MRSARKSRGGRIKTDAEIALAQKDRQVVLERLVERGSVTADTPGLLYKELGIKPNEMTITRFNRATYTLAESGKIRYHRRKLEEERSYSDQVRPITLTAVN